MRFTIARLPLYVAVQTYAFVALGINATAPHLQALCDSVHDLDCHGDDLHNHGKASSHEECCQACEQYQGCGAWTWNWQTKECYLKSACNDQRKDEACHSGVGTGPSPTPTPPSPSGDWVLTFQDDFDTLNTDVWHVMDSWGHVPGTAEKEFYMKDEVFVDGEGHLVLRTRYRPEVARTQGRDWTSGCIMSSPKGGPFLAHQDGINVTSGMTARGTGFTQQYGKFVWRAKPPKLAPTLWPALWMLPENIEDGECWPKGGEIDVSEFWGGLHEGASLSSFHYGYSCQKDSAPNGGGIAKSPPGNYTEDFHTFAVEWDAEKLDFFVDDQLIGSGSHRGIASSPYFMIMNVAICGQKYCDTGSLPHVEHRMLIDYVKVYKRADDLSALGSPLLVI